MDDTTRTIIENVRSDLRTLYGPRLLGLYLCGSYARGEQQEGSDIDFLVALAEMEDVGEELSRMSELGSRLSLDHDVTISFVPVSEWEFQNLRTPLLLNVRREGIAV